MKNDERARNVQTLDRVVFGIHRAQRPVGGSQSRPATRRQSHVWAARHLQRALAGTGTLMGWEGKGRRGRGSLLLNLPFKRALPDPNPVHSSLLSSPDLCDKTPHHFTQGTRCGAVLLFHALHAASVGGDRQDALEVRSMRVSRFRQTRRIRHLRTRTHPGPLAFFSDRAP